MICYKDRTYCGYWMLCKNSPDCDRALTDKVRRESGNFNLPICQFAEFPDCYEELWKDAEYYTTGKVKDDRDQDNLS